jgi:hypothetical protein
MAALSQPLVHANWHRAQPVQTSQHTTLSRKEHQPEDAAGGHSRATGDIFGVDAATLLCAFDASQQGQAALNSLLVHDWNGRAEDFFSMGPNGLMVRSLAALVPHTERTLWDRQILRLATDERVTFRGHLCTHGGRFHREVKVAVDALPHAPGGPRKLLLQFLPSGGV